MMNPLNGEKEFLLHLEETRYWTCSPIPYTELFKKFFFQKFEAFE